MQRLRDELFSMYEVLQTSFKYFCALGSSGSCFTLQLNEYTGFLEECKARALHPVLARSSFSLPTTHACARNNACPLLSARPFPRPVRPLPATDPGPGVVQVQAVGLRHPVHRVQLQR